MGAIHVPRIEVIDPLEMGRRRRVAPLRVVRETWKKPGGVTPPPAPTNPEALASWYAYWSARSVVKSGTAISQNTDLSGNAHHAAWSVASTYDATGFDGNAMITNLAASLATFVVGTNVIAAGTPHGILALIWDTVEAGNYYHTLLSLRTATANNNQNVVVSSDVTYGTFFNILPTSSGTAIGIGVQDFHTRPVVLIINYNGGAIGSAASYECFMDNTSKTISVLSGGAANNTSANQLNSYGNSSPPQFPFKNGKWSEIGILAGSVIGSSLRASIKTWVQYYYPTVTQA
jgi:hypothetical protein